MCRRCRRCRPPLQCSGCHRPRRPQYTRRASRSSGRRSAVSTCSCSAVGPGWRFSALLRGQNRILPARRPTALCRIPAGYGRFPAGTRPAAAGLRCRLKAAVRPYRPGWGPRGSLPDSPASSAACRAGRSAGSASSGPWSAGRSGWRWWIAASCAVPRCCCSGWTRRPCGRSAARWRSAKRCGWWTGCSPCRCSRSGHRGWRWPWSAGPAGRSAGRAWPAAPRRWHRC